MEHEQTKCSKGILTSNDICRIIGACSKAGVSEFSYMGLELVFGLGSKASSLYTDSIDYIQGQAENLDLTKTHTKKSFRQASENPSVDPSIKLIDDQLLEDMRKSQLMIEDPMRFEEEMIDEELRTINGQAANDR